MRGRMPPYLESSAQAIAFALKAGAAVEVVGTKFLAGLPIQYLEIDGVPIALPPEREKEAPGVRVEWLDGYVALYVTTNLARADNLLARAREMMETLG